MEDTVTEEFTANQGEGKKEKHNLLAFSFYRSVRIVVDIGKVYSSHKETYNLDQITTNIDSRQPRKTRNPNINSKS